MNIGIVPIGSIAAKKMAKQIVLVLVAIICVAYAPSVWTEEPEFLEEVLVQSVNGCGSWPIDHGDIATCEYAVLARRIISKLPAWRTEAATSCLVCEGSTCRPQSFTSHQTQQRNWCKRLFWTPRRIDKLRLTDEEAPELEVSFTYEISQRGRVENIQIFDLYGDWSEEKVHQVLAAGAKGTRYLPLTIDGVRYRIDDLDASYSLEGGVW
jgi:hypothetical protein